MFFWGGRRSGCVVVGKFEFWIPVQFRLLLKKKKNHFSLIFLHLLAALAKGRTWRGHCCLPDSLYGTVILMSLFSNHLYTKSFHEWLPCPFYQYNYVIQRIGAVQFHVNLYIHSGFKDSGKAQLYKLCCKQSLTRQ